MAALRRCAEAGEQARFLPDVTLKFFVVDRTTALLPVSCTEPDPSVRLGARVGTHRRPSAAGAVVVEPMACPAGGRERGYRPDRLSQGSGHHWPMKPV
jgi:hypothetical protein